MAIPHYESIAQCKMEFDDCLTGNVYNLGGVDPKRWVFRFYDLFYYICYKIRTDYLDSDDSRDIDESKIKVFALLVHVIDKVNRDRTSISDNSQSTADKIVKLRSDLTTIKQDHLYRKLMAKLAFLLSVLIIIASIILIINIPLIKNLGYLLATDIVLTVIASCALIIFGAFTDRKQLLQAYNDKNIISYIFDYHSPDSYAAQRALTLFNDTYEKHKDDTEWEFEHWYSSATASQQNTN